MKITWSSRAALLFIAAVFLLPLVLAWLMYNKTIDFQPASTRNLGELVQPPVAVNWDGIVLAPWPGREDHGTQGSSVTEALNGHWVVLHVVPDLCQAPCIEAIRQLHQVYRASGRHQARIRIALLLNESAPSGAAWRPEAFSIAFRLLEYPRNGLRETLDRIAGMRSSPVESSGSTYLIDPLGNIMMFYEAGSDPNHLNKDLKRLLTWSKLDEQS